MDREQAIEVIRSLASANDAAHLVAELQTSVRLRTQKIGMASLAPGQSRFGGCPDLPPGFEWPRYNGWSNEWDAKQNKWIMANQKETHLHFLAQIQLEPLRTICELAGLPAHGSLCFFYDLESQPWGYDPAQQQGWRVYYFDTADEKLVRTEHPHSVTGFRARPCKLSWTSDWTLPEYPFHLAKDWDWYHDILQNLKWHETVDKVLAVINGPPESNDLIHRFLGHPQHIQGEMRVECQLASNGLYCGDARGHNDPRATALKSGAKDWRLLLQIDTDDDGPGWMWGDCGRIYYWIKDADLRRRAFDQAWFVLQCS